MCERKRVSKQTRFVLCFFKGFWKKIIFVLPCRAPIAVGKAHISGEDMYMSAMKGKCLNILQIFQDTLWASGDKSVQVPILPSPIGLKASSFEDFAEKVNARINKEEAAEAGEEKADEIKEMISELRVEEYLNQQETRTTWNKSPIVSWIMREFSLMLSS